MLPRGWFLPLLACPAAAQFWEVQFREVQFAAVHSPEEPTSTPWWSEPVERPDLPEVGEDSWCRNPIDRFVLARLEAAGLAPSPEASPAALERRAHLILTGLAPEPGDESLGHGERVDRLLASRHFGERWARHWLDLARFAETNGFETNTPRPNAWPYRDWVVDSLNGDLPYDEFMFRQVAGDTVGDDPATGFLVAGAWDEVKSPDVVLTRNQRQDELSDVVNAVSAGFLGLTVACARCHDHKFDPVSQEDFFSLQAIFAGVQHGERPWRKEGEEARVEDLRSLALELQENLEAIEAASTPPEPTPGLVVIDELDSRRTKALVAAAGHGEIPAGVRRGEREDRGDLSRGPNLARGQYTWWSGSVHQDLHETTPRVEGAHRIWLSWGAGWGNHAPDATYWLETGQNRTLLAEVDQRRFADGTDSVRDVPLWSGLFDAGVHELEPESRIVLRSGDSGQPVTADVIVLEPMEGAIETAAVLPPRLRARVDARGNVERFAPTRAEAVRFTIHATERPAEPCIDELEVFSGEQNVALGAAVRTSGDYQGDPKHRPEHVNDGQYGNGRSWISDTSGRGWVELELTRPALVDSVAWARDREGVYGDRLARDYTVEVRDAAGEWHVVASGDDRSPVTGIAPVHRFAGHPDPSAVEALLVAERKVAAELADLAARPTVYAGRFVEPGETHLLHRGDPMQPEDVVAPDLPDLFGALDLDPDAPEAERRASFGRWLGDARNPLTARVIVNRLWTHHFGTGLVSTPSDFGVMGGAPSHPELLDWLAAELIESGWSLKHVHRLIATSATWRQSTARDPEAVAIDAGARLLWRFPPRRVEAEVVRDSILQASGSLDLTPGGPGYSAFEPNTNYVRNYVPRADFASDGMRRMIYMTKVRMERDATFGVFDTPDAGQVCSTRGRSTTPLQALALFNSPFVLDQADRLAARVTEEVGEGREAQVARAFELVLGREPGPGDLEAGRDLVAEHGLAALGRALFNSNEFLFLP